jgi:hypothetical protein
MVDQSPAILKTGFKDRDQATIERTTRDTSNLGLPLLLHLGNAKVLRTALTDFLSHLSLPLADGKNCLHEL